MLSLNQLIAQHGYLLVLDAASARVQIGLLRPAQPAIWHSAETDAGLGLFTGVEACLADAAASMDDIRAYVFCEGPGSGLGIRSVAMAVRTWQTIGVRSAPAYTFQSLPLLAREFALDGRAAPCAVISDARRDTWNCVLVDPQRGIGPLQRVSSPEIAALPGELWQPLAFRAWALPPRATKNCAYDVAALFSAHAEAAIFSATAAPDAFQHAAPDYKKWAAQIHTAPSEPTR